jgi:hypothetical protein
MNNLTLKMPVTSLVVEYEEKKAKLGNELQAYKESGERLLLSCTVQGTYGQENLDVREPYIKILERNLLKSAWLTLWGYIKDIATADDKREFNQSVSHGLPEFNMGNIRETFGHYIQDPRGNILRGLAEVFSSLDPAFKSHEKVKIGVKGLPKRVIVSRCGNYRYGYGYDKVKDILNALGMYQGKGGICEVQMKRLWDDEEALIKDYRDDDGKFYPARGVRLKRFKNENAHLFFEPDALVDINNALAEYYGDVLPDAYTEETAKQESTSVSKDLQFYPTPKKVVDRILDWVNVKGLTVLEPSCGDGQIMDEIVKRGGIAKGVEVHMGRARQAKAKGHSVYVANFLETVPQPSFDLVVMNPPFYGKHYEKHVRHAMKFLKDGGKLISILPVTARYDHHILDDLRPRWSDLPNGSFRESGTNINTTLCEIHKR